MEEMIYLGAQWGSFKDNETGRTVRYAHVFVAQKFDRDNDDNFSHVGMKSDKLKLDEPALVADLEPNTRCKFFFNQRGRVTGIEPLEKLSVPKASPAASAAGK